jgi:predicted nucleic acid-binding protein
MSLCASTSVSQVNELTIQTAVFEDVSIRVAVRHETTRGAGRELRQVTVLVPELNTSLEEKDT